MRQFANSKRKNEGIRALELAIKRLETLPPESEVLEKIESCKSAIKLLLKKLPNIDSEGYQ